MPIGDEEQAEWDRLNKEYNELVAEVGDVINYQVLRFAVPLRSRRAAEVNLKVRQLYLQIRAEGFPVWRFHSDRAREWCNSRLRTWLAERGVIVTTGEAQSPQQNGRGGVHGALCEDRGQVPSYGGPVGKGKLAYGYEVCDLPPALEGLGQGGGSTAGRMPGTCSYQNIWQGRALRHGCAVARRNLPRAVR